VKFTTEQGHYSGGQRHGSPEGSLSQLWTAPAASTYGTAVSCLAVPKQNVEVFVGYNPLFCLQAGSVHKVYTLSHITRVMLCHPNQLKVIRNDVETITD
jgi:hypothetical protein